MSSTLIQPLFGFVADYVVERLTTAVEATETIAFSAASSRKARAAAAADTPVLIYNVAIDHPSLWLSITPKAGPAWQGRFAPGHGKLDGIYSTPVPHVVCVVCAGAGYWVDVLNPRAFKLVRAIPVIEVVEARVPNLILFVDFVRVAGYGAADSWLSEDLSWDGIKVESVDEEKLRGNAWDAPTNKWVPFSLDLSTGQVEGGSSPGRPRTNTQQ